MGRGITYREFVSSQLNTAKICSDISTFESIVVRYIHKNSLNFGHLLACIHTYNMLNINETMLVNK